ncbi:hypothetical protein ACR6C2_42225 [Streptomyces sp. INA 01156]
MRRSDVVLFWIPRTMNRLPGLVSHIKWGCDTTRAGRCSVRRGSRRTGGERAVPLVVWRSEHFQRWYATRRAAGCSTRAWSGTRGPRTETRPGC